MLVSRTIRLAGATGQIRTATFQKREHLVVPVVALVEGVVWAVNSPKPELVLAEEFSRVPAGWNGRAVVGDHPDINGIKVSANSPNVFEANCFGTIFNAAADGNKLTMEAWLDPARAEEVGPDAVRVCERARNGEPIEVSVGVFMTLEETGGVYDGKEYHGVWRDLVPDHLAMLPEGMQGACSNEMGCGAPRAASVHLVTPDGLVPLYLEKPKEPEKKMTAASTTETPKRSLKERFMALLGLAGEADMSDVNIRQALSKAAQESVPGFMWVEEVFAGKNEVIVASMTGDHDLKLVRGKYTIAEGGDATIDKDSLTEVKLVQSYEEVAAAAEGGDKPQPTAACGCKNKEKNMSREARVAALIASGKFKEEDKTWLNQVPEDRLSALEGNTQQPPATTPSQPPATPTTQPTTPAQPAQPATTETPATPAAPTTASSVVGAPSQQTVDQYIGLAPREIQESLREGVRLMNERRGALIAGLKGTGRNKFSDEELNSRTTDELQRLADLAAVPPPPTFEGRGLPRVASTDGVPEAPVFSEVVAAGAKK